MSKKKGKASYAYLQVPVKRSWKATDNGKKTVISTYLGTFMKFKLKPGVNKIQLTYTIPKLKFQHFDQFARASCFGVISFLAKN